jgi:phage-related protein (TIGR01555 family)
MDSDADFEALPGQHVEPERVHEMIRQDGWQNFTTGTGVAGYDKSINTNFITDIFTRSQLVELWRGDDMAAKVIECLPMEAMKKKYELNITDEGDYGDLKDQIEQAIDDLELNEKLLQSLMMERGLGGSALLIGANDGQDMSRPLNMDAIVDLHYITPLEPDELSPLTSYSDPLHPKYGKTELYQIHSLAQSAVGLGDPLQRTLPSTSVIHETRLIIFPGLRVSKTQVRTGVMGVHWGDSVLNRVVKSIANFNMGYANTGIILSEQGLPIFHMKELAKLVNANRTDIVKARLSLLFQQMSTARAAVIDSEENYERKAMPLTGLAEILDRLAMRVAAAVEMPITKLMGQSPKGLGNEGESDMETWYDTVATYQEKKIRRPLRRLLQIVMRACRVQEPAKWSIKFLPLRQLSDKELAEARSVQSNTDVAYVSAGILMPEEIRASRFSGEYSYETQLDDAAFAAMNQMGGPGQQMTPEDMMAMGLDPNNPDDVAKAQGMMGDMGGGGGEPMLDPETGEPMLDPETGEPMMQPPQGGEVDPETGEPLEPELDPETGEPLEPELDPETGEPMAKAAGMPGGGKPPFGGGGKPPFGGGGKPPFGGGGKPPFGGGGKPPFGKPAMPGAKPPLGGGKPPAQLGPDGKPLPPEKGLEEGLEKEPKLGPDGKPLPPEEKRPGDVPGEDEGAAPVEQAKPPGEITPEKQGPTARGGATEEDRQRMSSRAPGTPLHVIDRDKNGKISPAEAQAADMSIDDILAMVDALNQELNGGGKVAPASPDQDGEVELPEEGEPEDGEEVVLEGEEEEEVQVEGEEEPAPEDEEEEPMVPQKKPPFGKKKI